MSLKRKLLSVIEEKIANVHQSMEAGDADKYMRLVGRIDSLRDLQAVVREYRDDDEDESTLGEMPQ